METLAPPVVPAPTASLIEFEYTIDAATNNSNLLAEVNYSLGKFIDQHPGSTMSYGSELRPLEQLEPLLTHHPSLERFKRNHTYRIDYSLGPIPEEARLTKLENSIERGNHKSALLEKERPQVTKLMAQESNWDTGYSSQWRA